MRTFFVLVLLLVLGAGGAWYYAGKRPGPVIEIVQPTKGVGQSGEAIVDVLVPAEKLQRLEVSLEQGDRKTVLFNLSTPTTSAQLAHLPDRVRVTRPIGKHELPDLQEGKARLIVSATRPVLFGFRSVSSTASKDFEVHLIPPQISVLSQFHFINQGGSEMVVYRTSEGAQSGVRVGQYEYPGFPASGAGIANATPDMRVAFFALLWNQDTSSPISIFSRDDYGNESHASFDYRVIPKSFRKSRIPIDDRFLAKVVPAILQNTPNFNVPNPSDLVDSFLHINRELRQQNGATIAEMSKHTAPQILWQGAFKQLANTAVEAGFADQRTYVYQGKEIDQQVHLGFDLASYANTPVHAANRGRVVHAAYLGIYGNCVILDHGMGLQSLYAHLSSIEVKVGEEVQSGQELGRSGSTGMAGGDHLHFTMLLNGNAITPIDWWSAQWVNDRITRKLREAGGGTAK
ncbi:MAG TPA: M23 family metallopeptidase [Steroidobacteraceae bacterium]|nr:M23 family metallopeptidase [Steroidobacteraceae bacterium]